MNLARKNTGLFAYCLCLAYLFACIANLQDVTEMVIWAGVFSLLAVMDEARGRNWGFALGWVATILGTCAAFALFGPLWSPLGFAAGYVLSGWTIVDRLQSRSRDLKDSVS